MLGGKSDLHTVAHEAAHVGTLQARDDVANPCQIVGGLIAIADALCGPYNVQKPTWTYPAANRPQGIDSIYPHRTSVPDPAITKPSYAWEEDPHIWYSAGVYHVIYSGSGDRIGWHLYSTERVEGGPVPTRIVVSGEQSFEAAGDIDSPAPHSAYDPNFQVTTEFYDGSVAFTIPVRALPVSPSGANKIIVQVRYQTCTQTICLAPKLLKLERSIQIAGASAHLSQPPARPVAAEEKASPGLAVGSQVPDFEFTDFNGKQRRLAEYRGHYVLLDFWATWCSPCLADIPHLKEIYLKYRGKGFEIIGMDSETLGQESADAAFAKETQARAHEIVSTRGSFQNAAWTPSP